MKKHHLAWLTVFSAIFWRIIWAFSRSFCKYRLQFLNPFWLYSSVRALNSSNVYRSSKENSAWYRDIASRAMFNSLASLSGSDRHRFWDRSVLLGPLQYILSPNIPAKPTQQGKKTEQHSYTFSPTKISSKFSAIPSIVFLIWLYFYAPSIVLIYFPIFRCSCPCGSWGYKSNTRYALCWTTLCPSKLTLVISVSHDLLAIDRVPILAGSFPPRWLQLLHQIVEFQVVIIVYFNCLGPFYPYLMVIIVLHYFLVFEQ